MGSFLNIDYAPKYNKASAASAAVLKRERSAIRLLPLYSNNFRRCEPSSTHEKCG